MATSKLKITYINTTTSVFVILFSQLIACFCARFSSVFLVQVVSLSNLNSQELEHFRVGEKQHNERHDDCSVGEDEPKLVVAYYEVNRG